MPHPQTPPVRVNRLDHAAVVVADVEASRRFYVGVLGMTEVPRPAFTFGGAWFEAGGTLIHVIEQHEASGPAGNPVAEGASISRTRHLAFAVDDAAAIAEPLRAAGVPIVAGPKGRPDGAAQTVVLDPDGTVIELVSETGGAALRVDGAQVAEPPAGAADAG